MHDQSTKVELFNDSASLTLDLPQAPLLKCICIEIFDNFLLANMKDGKNQEESSLPFVNICFRSRDMSFQSLGNLEKKCDKKISSSFLGTSITIGL